LRYKGWSFRVFIDLSQILLREIEMASADDFYRTEFTVRSGSAIARFFEEHMADDLSRICLIFASVLAGDPAPRPPEMLTKLCKPGDVVRKISQEGGMDRFEIRGEAPPHDEDWVEPMRIRAVGEVCVFKGEKPIYSFGPI
jgi:hypothetical protein